MASDPTNGDQRDSEKKVIVRSFGTHEAAELAAASLEARGIECWVVSDAEVSAALLTLPTVRAAQS